MIEDMARNRPPYLTRDVSRHGTVRWYFRRPGFPKVRIPGDYGSAEFMAAYEAALRGAPAPTTAPARGTSTGTLAWLAVRYMETSAWSDLSPATRKQRGNILHRVVTEHGHVPASSITAESLAQSIENRSKTPAAARNFLETMRGLYRWAKKAGHVEVDPTEGVKAKRARTDGFLVWTEDDIAVFEQRWPLGTRERLAFDILLYTGFRRGDAVRLGRQHVRNGIITMRTEKTGIEVAIPVLPALAKSLAACPPGADLAYIVSSLGRAYTKESFGNWFHDVCVATGLPKRSAHGLRKACATRFVEAGATQDQLDAWMGWTGGQMASLYTRKANRSRMARAAGALLSHPNAGGTISVQPSEKKGA